MVELRVKVMLGLLLLAPLLAPLAIATDPTDATAESLVPLPSQNGKCVGVNPDPTHPIDVYDCPS